MLFICSRCGCPTRPLPYFSRAVNLAKAMLLLIPFSVFGPLVFFLLRKDQLICSICKKMLGGKADVPLLRAVSPDGQLLPGFLAAGLAVYDSGQDEGALQRQSQRFRARAWTWGALSLGMAGIGVALGVSDGLNAAAPFLVAALPFGMGAAISAIRCQMFGRQAASKRLHEQRARVLRMARVSGGQLTVSLVATELRIELDDAERLLSSMVDGHRVDMEVDDDGRISYVFPELKPLPDQRPQ